MKPVDQTVFGDPGGDCFRACVASLLELDLDQVPHFAARDWPRSLELWLAERGLCDVWICWTPDGWVPPGPHIRGGQCSRGSHAVVAVGAEIVHDPHPSREGLHTIEDCVLLVPVDVARWRQVDAPKEQPA